MTQSVSPELNHPVKILQIVGYYYPHIGGIEQIARDVSIVLKEHGNVEQKVICFNESTKETDSGTKRTEMVTDFVDGVEVIRCGCFMKLLSQSLSASYPAQLDRLMDGFNPDIIFFHYPNPFLAQFLLKHREKSFRLYLYWHLDITKQRVVKHLFKNQTRELIARADKVLGSTLVYLDKSEYSSYFGKKKYLLPYMLDEARLDAAGSCGTMSEEKRENGKIVCFALGRQVEYKGIRYLIQAARQLDDRFVFYIAGEGKETEKLKKLASGDKKIVFLGQVTELEKIRYLSSCDIFCFPSITRNEAFGIALAEAMYFGKPAVTFHIEGSGVNFVSVNNVTCIECPNRDSAAFADALCRLADNPELRKAYGEAGRERVLNLFSKRNFAERLEQLVFQ